MVEPGPGELEAVFLFEQLRRRVVERPQPLVSEDGDDQEEDGQECGGAGGGCTHVGGSLEAPHYSGAVLLLDEAAHQCLESRLASQGVQIHVNGQPQVVPEPLLDRELELVDGGV